MVYSMTQYIDYTVALLTSKVPDSSIVCVYIQLHLHPQEKYSLPSTHFHKIHNFCSASSADLIPNFTQTVQYVESIDNYSFMPPNDVQLSVCPCS